MAKTYKPQESIPVAVVTLATALSGQQHIILQSRYDVQGYYSLKKNLNVSNADKETTEKQVDKIIETQLTKSNCDNLTWAIKNCNISLLRDWGTSHALITLITNLPSYDSEIPPLPRVDMIRGGNYPYLTCEDEIRIYMGYIDSPLTPITGDMLDELPININDDYKHNPNKPLAPVFWGFIDKIDFDASSKGKGVSYIISCRDRTRIFADTRITSIPSLAGVLNSNSNNNQSANPNGAPWQIIKDIAKSVIGFQINNTNNVQQHCWKNIICPDPLKNTEKGEDKDVEFYSAYTFDNINRKSSPIEIEKLEGDTLDPSLWLRRATHKTMDRLSRPRFHMWLQRPPLAKEGMSNQWQILDKSCLEVVKWIASLEERPTDFFASHVNGDFVIGPKFLDTSGFYDPDRAYRTYFFRSWPKTKKDGTPISPPCANQLILSMRSFTSSIATFNRFVVVDASQTSGIEASLLQDVTMSIDSVPWIFDGEGNKKRDVSVPCRTKIIYDGNLANYQNPAGGSLLVALAAARNWGQDLNGIQITVIGDPTAYPSEAIRIYNTVLHDKCIRTETGTTASSYNRELTTSNAINKYSNNNPPVITNSDAPADSIKPSSQNSKVARDLVEQNTQVTDKDELVLPVYKVRSVVHTFSSQGANAGFLTQLVGSADLS